MNSGYCVTGYGDIISFRPGFVWDTFISSMPSVSTYSANGNPFASDSVGYNWSLQRGISGMGSSERCSIRGEISQGTYSGGDPLFGSFPPIVDGVMRLSKVIIFGNTQSDGARGYLPGVFYIPHTNISGNVFPLKTIVEGTGAMAGKKMTPVNSSAPIYYPASSGMGFFDVSGPWR